MPELAELDRILTDNLQAPEALLAFLHELDGLGPRLVGAEGEHRAQSLLMDRFRGLGLEVDFESFPVKTYLRGETEVVLHTGEGDESLTGLARVFSPSTRRAERFELIDLGKGEEGDFDRAASRIAGRAVYVSQVCPEKYKKALHLGAAAYLEPSPENHDVVFMGTMPENGEKPHVPRIKLTASSGRAITRASQKEKPLEITLRVTGETRPAESGNVVASLRGRTDLPEIVLGAHLDTFNLSSGALDNGTGVALVFELARIFTRLPKLRRTIRFVLFTGEEVGRIGSEKYVAGRDAASVGCFFNFDVPLGGDLVLHIQAGNERNGFWGGLRETLGDPFEIEHVLRRNSDHYSFYRAGIPCIMMRAKPKPGAVNPGDLIHSCLDTIEKVDPLELHESTRLSGRILLRLAEAEDLPFESFEPASDRAELYDDT
ncbi:MAG: M28 family peptidase [Planctomycetota bacterium]|jgi:hypothetical protein